MNKHSTLTKDRKVPRYKETTGITYIRVSSPDQVHNFSIETQIEKCQEYADREKIKLLGQFVEEGKSAKSTNRQELRNLLDFIAKNKNKIDFVVLYKIDRWARSSTDFYATKGLLLKYGTNLLSATEPIDDTPVGRFLETTMAGLAQLDNELKGIRVRDNMKTKALDGWCPTKAKYGYKNNKETKRLEPHPIYFNPVQKMLKMFVDGKDSNYLADYMNSLGLTIKGERTKIMRKFTVKDVNRILHQSKFYAGKFDWGDLKDIKGNHESMISWDEHLKIQDLLNSKSPDVAPKDDRPIFILNFGIAYRKGFLTCDECHTRMKHCKTNGNGGEYLLYFCPNPQCKAKVKSIQKHELERMFEDILEKITPAPKYIQFFKEIVIEAWRKDQETIESNQKQAKTRLERLKEERTDTIAMRRREELTLDDYKNEMARIDNDIVATEVVINENRIDQAELELLLQQAEAFLKNIKPLYRGFNPEHKRKLALQIFPNGISYADGVCKTNGLSILFEFLEKIKSEEFEKDDLVTLPGIEPGLTN